MSFMFYYTGLSEIDFSSFNTSNVTTMLNMLNGTRLRVIDFSNIDTRNVIDMNGMFYSYNYTNILERIKLGVNTNLHTDAWKKLFYNRDM